MNEYSEIRSDKKIDLEIIVKYLAQLVAQCLEDVDEIEQVVCDVSPQLLRQHGSDVFVQRGDVKCIPAPRQAYVYSGRQN